MFGLGYQELLVILVIVLILFGANRLPELARSLGSSMKEFKKGIDEGKRDNGNNGRGTSSEELFLWPCRGGEGVIGESMSATPSSGHRRQPTLNAGFTAPSGRPPRRNGDRGGRPATSGRCAGRRAPSC